MQALLDRSISPFLALVTASFAACSGGGTDPGENGGGGPPIPSVVVKVQGDAQTGIVGRNLDLRPTVEVRDASGNPMSDAAVTFTVAGGGGSVSPGSTSTDASGRASASWTLGTDALADQLLRVEVGNLSTTFTADAESDAPVQIRVVSGDKQSGTAGATLPDPLVVEVVDQFGNGVPGVTVSFSTESGSVSSEQAVTDDTGRASTTATLGSADELGGMAEISPATLDPARMTLHYSAQLQAVVSLGASFLATVPDIGSVTFDAVVEAAASVTWSLASGGIPGGMILSENGSISGTPTASGQATFTVRATANGESLATREYTLTVCEPPLQLEVGQSLAMDPPSSSGCGLFLPSGAGDRYRIGVVWESSLPLSSTATVTLDVERPEDGAGAPTPGPAPIGLAGAAAATGSGAPPAGENGLRAHLTEALEREAVTERLHHRLRESERRWVVSEGSISPLPSLAEPSGGGPGTAAPSSVAPAPDPLNYNAPMQGCGEVERLQGKLLLETDEVVVYQESGQNVDSPVTPSALQQMVDFYGAYGRQTIATYFGGLPDVDGNGKLIVIVTPFEDSEFEGAAAFVLSRDLVPVADCPWSNEAEITYFNVSVINSVSQGNYQALATLVHEVKHIASLYNRLVYYDNSGSPEINPFHPTWIEEGTADIAAEISSRTAWAAAGGPAVDATADDFSSINAENYGVLLRMARVVGTLSSQPNALTEDPIGASSGHTFYGSSWHFHRFVGDAYFGGATSEAAFFLDQHAATSRPGVSFIEDYVGQDFSQLQEEMTLASVVSGTAIAGQAARGFSGYDFPSMTEQFCSPNPLGVYPWPVTTTGSREQGGCSEGGFDPSREIQNPAAPFQTATWEGPIGAGGIRVHEFVSDGSGQGLDIHMDVTSNASAEVRVWVVRME